MDLFEKAFGKLSRRLKMKRAEHATQFSVSLEEHYSTALVFAQGMAMEREILLKAADRPLGVVLPDCILLPAQANFFDDRSLNRDLLLHQALVAGAILSEGLKSSYTDPAAVAERCMEIVLHQRRIRDSIGRAFPIYAEWSGDLFDRFERALSQSGRLSESDRGWRKIMAAGAGERLFRLTAFPDCALAPWCELQREKQVLDGIVDRTGLAPGQRSKASAQRKEKKAAEVRTVDLEKEAKKENPVTHSFEKLETADEYQGGYRHADGADDLAEHRDALDELDLKHVTRGGEAARSVYQADISELIETPAVSQGLEGGRGCVSLPEWDYRKNDLVSDYCKLFIESPVVAEPSPPDALGWYERLMATHASTLSQWRQRLESLVNQRSWKDRQWDGSEISIDAYVRYLSDSRNSKQGDARLYLRSVRAAREFSAFVLVDQSLSTDSWVMNRRVLDVELESIALMSYLLRELNEPIAVAATSSHTRHRCSFRLYKDFYDDWDSFLVRAPQIEPCGYTRLGPAIRHATNLLVKSGGRQKLLILLTDGKPTDYDRYEGRYGIEDIRHSILEAKQVGVQVRALAIEKEAKNYFSHLFGKNEYQIIQDPATLPEALFRIYLEAARP